MRAIPITHNPSYPLKRASRHWFVTRDGDPVGLALYERHYSCRRYKDGWVRRFFCGPGEKLVLITKSADALFVWRRQQFSMDGQSGVNCAVFRNEGSVQRSRLIREATAVAWKRWPAERLFTYVNPQRIRSTNPGYCFKEAGWKQCGTTKERRLTILAIESVKGRSDLHGAVGRFR